MSVYYLAPSHYVSVELPVKVMLVWRLVSHPHVSLNELLHKSLIFPSSVALAHTEQWVSNMSCQVYFALCPFPGPSLARVLTASLFHICMGVDIFTSNGCAQY